MLTANREWIDTVAEVLRKGQGVAPQSSTGAGGRYSFEILAHTMCFSMQYPIVTLKPNTSWLYMVTEPIWVINGSNQLEWAPEIEKIQGPYSDNGKTLNGAYGLPYKQQMNYIIHKLNEDPNSRQAVMTIWRRIPKPSKDIPCTTALQFLIRDKKIHCIVTMRSSDVGMGLPYDMLTFTCMAAEIGSRLKEPVELGECFITAGSRHVYKDQVDKLAYLVNNVRFYDDEYLPWYMWKWPGIKQVMFDAAFAYYEDRNLGQSIVKDRLLRASG